MSSRSMSDSYHIYATAAADTPGRTTLSARPNQVAFKRLYAVTLSNRTNFTCKPTSMFDVNTRTSRFASIGERSREVNPKRDLCSDEGGIKSFKGAGQHSYRLCVAELG